MGDMQKMYVIEHVTPQDIKEWLSAKTSEEGFLLQQTGSIQTLLPGDYIHRWDNAAALVSFPETLICHCITGTRKNHIRSVTVPGGWAEFDCQLISAKRFVLKKSSEILKIKNAEQILGFMEREILKNVLLDLWQEKNKWILWQSCRGEVRKTLLDIGWQLNSFSLELHGGNA